MNASTDSSIGFSITPSRLGWTLLAATRRGVCQVAFGDGEAELRRRLAGRFPFATLERDDARLAPFVARLLAYLDGATPRLDLPLDVGGTRFQREVWSALRAIPRGDTRSYGEIARAVGRPGAARAVARACADNPVAVAIPCHRVVPGRGGVGGYAFGPARKRALLEAEGAGVALAAPPAAASDSSCQSESAA